jgi:dihydroneopterin aldolase
MSVAAAAAQGHGGAMPLEPSPRPSAAARYTVTVRGLVLLCSIGIRPREREAKQRVRISVDLVAGPGHEAPGAERRRSINYEKIVAAVRQIARGGTAPQVTAAKQILSDARRALYRIVAEDES